ncbi:MAG: TolC family protein [Bacteroidales bacterium]|nr:MAG: TolC family protein [Bacteroidales bacterium]
MKIKTSLLLGVIFLVNICYGQSDSIYSFTLQEAQEYALKHNYEAKNSLLEIKKARKKVWETTAIGLPQVSGSIYYQHIPGDIPTFSFGEAMLPLFSILDSLHPGAFSSFGEDMASSESAIAVKNATTYGLTVSQLVFSGEYIVGLQASKTFLSLSENAKEKKELDTKQAVSSSYYSILALEKNKAILDTSIANLNSTLKEFRILNEKGFIEDTEVDQIELTLRNTQNASRTLEQQIELSYKLFKLLLGIDLESVINLTQGFDEFLVSVDVVNSPTYSNFDISNNIDYKVLENQERISELSLKRERSKYLPMVSAFYSYTDITNKADFDFTINHIVGLNVNIPIFSSGQRIAQVQQARIELEKTRNIKDVAEENIMLMVEQAAYDLEKSIEKYNNELFNIELSNKIYQKTLIKHREGMASSLDLAQAHNQYLASNSNYTNSILELLTSKLNYDKILNNL